MLSTAGYRLSLYIAVFLVSASTLRAESDWIAPGAFIDWPESLKEIEKPQNFPPESSGVLQAQFLPEPIPEPIQIEAVHVPEPLPITAHQLDQVGTYTWQLLPEGLLYHNYLAGEKEPRTAATWLYERNRGLIWEAAVGSRWGLLRHGTQGTDAEGFQFDVEGGALVRIDPEAESDLEAADFRAGFVLTWREGPWRWKTGYYHISCHVGDEFQIRNPTYQRVNYVRDSILFGTTYDFTPEFQGYGEIAFALGTGGGAEPVELQFGLQYSPACGTGWRGAPFAAINGHLRQELRFGGSVNVEAGWAWRGGRSNSLFRAGFQHYNGNSMQWSFVDRYESLTGGGIWFDF